MTGFGLRAGAIVLMLGLSMSVSGTPFRMLLESNAGEPPGDEVFMVTFPTFDDLMTGTFSAAGFSDFGINDNFSAGGLAYDGQYRLLLESNAGEPPGGEVFMVTFPTFDDLMTGTFSAAGFSDFGINDNFSAGGLAYEGSFEPVPVPLPPSLGLLTTGLITLFLGDRRRSPS